MTIASAPTASGAVIRISDSGMRGLRFLIRNPLLAIALITLSTIVLTGEIPGLSLAEVTPTLNIAGRKAP